MASIEIPCANPDCDSNDIDYITNAEIGNEVAHKLVCDICKTEFDLYTRIQNVIIPKETS